MKKKFNVFSKKKGLLIYLSSMKRKLAVNFLKKKICTWPKTGLGVKELKVTDEQKVHRDANVLVYNSL